MDRAKELVIVSGKGGTGKTTLTASLVKIIKEKVIVDADVDASDLFILLSPKLKEKSKFKGKAVASIDQGKCTHCGLCEQYCRFDAIHKNENGDYTVNSYKCDGCYLCSYVCPVGAISMVPQVVGEWYLSDTDFGAMVHARLNPGDENSGNLVTMVKHQAQLIASEKKISRIIIDGPPGTGCPVISALSGATVAIIVTEPTLSGMHDLDRILKLAEQFKVVPKIVINKYTLNSDNVKSIEKFAEENGVEIIGKIPFDKCIVDKLSHKLTPIDGEGCDEVKKEIFSIAGKVLPLIS
jgi:MinD superfamily P-loop ATPase